MHEYADIDLHNNNIYERLTWNITRIDLLIAPQCIPLCECVFPHETHM